MTGIQRRLLPYALLVAGACGGLTACGGSDGAPNGALGDGRRVFDSAGCGGCHTLAAAGARGQVGPNLDELRPSADTAARKVREGGAGMPSFADRLSDAEIEAVARFVAENAGR